MPYTIIFAPSIAAIFVIGICKVVQSIRKEW